MIVRAESVRADVVEFVFTGTAVLIRYRIDGVWFDELVLARYFHLVFGETIQSVCGLKILDPGDHRHVRIDTGEKEHLQARLYYNITDDGWMYRISLPDVKTQLKDLLKLGISQSTLKRYRKAFETPKGMVIVSGPPGSGRTTTLYATLRELKEKGKKIVTFESPAKRTFKGITQHEISKKNQMVEALAEVFKSPPDVLMISDIDDPEVLELAFQAAEQGMTVLTRVEAESAPKTLVHLAQKMEMPVDRVVEVVKGVLSQRLLRRSCPYCSEEVEPTGKDKKLLALMGRRNIRKITVENGCDFCRWVGLAGRTGVFEFLPIAGPVAEIFRNDPEVIPLRREMKKRGLKRFMDYAYLKAYDGITTLAEAQRVATPVPKSENESPNSDAPLPLSKEVQTVYESGAVTSIAPVYRFHLAQQQGESSLSDKPTTIRKISEAPPLLTVIYTGDPQHRTQAQKVLEGELDENAPPVEFHHVLNLSNGEVVLNQLGQLRALLAPKPVEIPLAEPEEIPSETEEQEAPSKSSHDTDFGEPDDFDTQKRRKPSKGVKRGPHTRALHLDPNNPVMTAETVTGAIAQSCLNFFTNGQKYAKGLIELVIYENATPLSLMFIFTLVGLLLEGFVASRAIEVTVGLGFSPLTLLFPVFHHLDLGLPDWIGYTLGSGLGLLLISMVFWLTLKLLGDELPIMLLITLVGFPRAVMMLPIGIVVLLLQSQHVPHLGYIVFLVGLIGLWRMIAMLRSFAYQFSEAVIHIVLVLGISWTLFGVIVVTDERIDYKNTKEYQIVAAFIQQMYDPDGYQAKQEKKTIDRKKLEQAMQVLNNEEKQKEAIEKLKKMTEQIKNLKATEIHENYEEILEQVGTNAAALNACETMQTDTGIINDMTVQVLMRPEKAKEMTSLVQEMIQAGETKNPEAFVEADEKLEAFLEDFSENEAKQEDLVVQAAILGPEESDEGELLRYSLSLQSTSPKVSRPVVYWDLDYNGKSFHPHEQHQPEDELSIRWPDDGEYRIAARVGDGVNALSPVLEKTVRINNVPPTILPTRKKYIQQAGSSLRIESRVNDPANEHDTYVIEYDFDYDGGTFKADESVENHNILNLDGSKLSDGIHAIAMRPRDEDCGYGNLAVVQVAKGAKAAQSCSENKDHSTRVKMYALKPTTVCRSSSRNLIP